MTGVNIQIGTRDSNIELLRIVCMFLIVFQHCLVLCAFPEIWDVETMSPGICVAGLLAGLTDVGVNCLCFISGYYRIKLKIRSILNFYLVCAFYSLLGYLIHIYVDDAQIGMGLIRHSLLCISQGNMWFVKCYAGLMLLSPLLNASIEHMSQKTYNGVLLLLTIFNVYFGYIWQDPMFNANGYTIANFVYIYMIGGYISRYANIEWLSKHRKSCLIIYVIAMLLWGARIGFIHYFSIREDRWIWGGYNNPFVLVGSICFFLYFLSIPRFYNKWINWFASGTFAVYLLHFGDYTSKWFVKCVGQIAELLQKQGVLSATIVGMVITAIAIELAICLIDKKRAVITKPIVDKVCAIYSQTWRE